MHGSAHDQASRLAGVSATPQRLAPPVLQGNRPSWGLWSARNSQQFRALAARQALRKRVASWGFWGGRAGGQLHGRAGAGASSLHFWGCPRATSQGLSKLTVIWGSGNQRPGRHPMLRKWGQLSTSVSPFLEDGGWPRPRGGLSALGAVWRTWAVRYSQELLCL